MGSFSVVHWFVMALVAALVVIPVCHILNEGGRSRAWALLVFLGPLGLIILLWVALRERRRADYERTRPEFLE
jgi:uncharacterized membrane protein